MLLAGPDSLSSFGSTAEDLTINSAPFSCLAIETATDLPSIALLRGATLAVRQARGMRAPSSAVFEWVRELLDETRTSFSQLDCIAFGAGPGSFTGVRVAVALAQGLGYARRVPLCPVSTLAALAAGVLETTAADSAACCLDARMGEVYFGVYRRDREQGVRALTADALLNPEFVRLPEEGAFLAAGPGWAAYPQLAGRLQARLVGADTEHLPSAADVARLARPRFLAGHVVSAAEARPNYLRDRVTSVA
jgi:tRNA threonylcarbamoyladenosine biosynthesis protein TsaB